MIPRLRRRPALPDAATLQRTADARREHPTRAETALAAILCGLNDGALDGRFRREWVCGGRWIVDFYFPEVRLAIEVDGGYHRSPTQRSWDLYKASELEAAGVTLLRVTNQEVSGDRERLLAEACGGRGGGAAKRGAASARRSLGRALPAYALRECGGGRTCASTTSIAVAPPASRSRPKTSMPGRLLRVEDVEIKPPATAPQCLKTHVPQEALARPDDELAGVGNPRSTPTTTHIQIDICVSRLREL